MVERGDGKKSGSIKDLNTGYRKTTLYHPADIYVSCFDPDGLANMPKSAAAIEPGTPLLWNRPTSSSLGRTACRERGPPNEQ